MNNQHSIPVNLIRQWHFCPRIPYYQELLGAHISRPVWVRQGNVYETMQRHLFRRRNLSRFNLQQGKLHTQLSLSHATYPFHGIADILIETQDAVYVVEIKLNLPVIRTGVMAQLTALSMLAGAQFGKKSTDAFILYGRKVSVKHLHITEDMQRQVCQTARNIANMLASGIKPDSTAQQHQCAQCEYLNYCNDR